MLHRIVIENFFSIADKQELVFAVPGNAPDLACFKASRSNKDIRLPVVVGFFGSNASGKTTVLRALTFMADFACNSVSLESGVGYNNILDFQPYRHTKWWDKPTKIVIEFDSRLSATSKSAIFRYELHIAHNGQDNLKKTVAYEALSYVPEGRARSLFERENQQFRFWHDFGISKSMGDPKDVIRDNASVISTLAMLNHPVCDLLRQLVRQLRTNVWGLNKFEVAADKWLSYYQKYPEYLAALNRELRRFDIGIESMNIHPEPAAWDAKFQHAGLDSPVSLNAESHGTRRFIAVFPRLYGALETGSVAAIDEIDSDLHPLLLPELFRWFEDPERNKHGAQLFFTAHNPALLDNLEKEQVYFTEKPYGKPTVVYGARDIQGLRREPSLMKKYLLGELGAVPRVG